MNEILSFNLKKDLIINTMKLTFVILSAVVAVSASEDANLTYTVYAAESAWLGLTTDERIKIPIYKVQ